MLICGISIKLSVTVLFPVLAYTAGMILYQYSFRKTGVTGSAESVFN